MSGSYRMTVEAAKPGAAPPEPVVRYTPGPVDVKAYEVSHATSYEVAHQEVKDEKARS